MIDGALKLGTEVIAPAADSTAGDQADAIYAQVPKMMEIFARKNGYSADKREALGKVLTSGLVELATGQMDDGRMVTDTKAYGLLKAMTVRQRDSEEASHAVFNLLLVGGMMSVQPDVDNKTFAARVLREVSSKIPDDIRPRRRMANEARETADGSLPDRREFLRQMSHATSFVLEAWGIFNLFKTVEEERRINNNPNLKPDEKKRMQRENDGQRVLAFTEILSGILLWFTKNEIINYFETRSVERDPNYHEYLREVMEDMPEILEKLLLKIKPQLKDIMPEPPQARHERSIY